MDLSKLKEPFDPTDIEWRVQQDGVNGNGPWAMVLAYVTNRAIQNRLDDVCGPENWQNHYTSGPNGGTLCGISVRVGDEWVTKWDGADNTDIEAVKGGLSDSMKRAAVQWGIGRYLYNLEATFAKITDVGRYRGYAYPTRDDKKAHRNGVKYKWNPPDLPKWALPENYKPEVEPDAPSKKPPKPKDPKEGWDNSLASLKATLDQAVLDTVITAEDRGKTLDKVDDISTTAELEKYKQAVMKHLDKKRTEGGVF